MTPKSCNDKYSTALRTAKKICAVLSENGSAVFAERLAVLEKLFSYWANDKDVRVVEEKPSGKEDFKRISDVMCIANYLFVLLSYREHCIRHKAY